MLKDLVKGKVGVFIDGENVFYAQKNLGWRISYKKFMSYLKAQCGEDVKVFFYTGVDQDNHGQKKFLSMMEQTGYSVVTRPIKKIRLSRGRYKWKNNLDIELVWGIVDNMDSIDSVVLVSGDSDFASSLRRAKEKGKNVIAISSRGRVAREILEIAKYVNMGLLKEELSQ